MPLRYTALIIGGFIVLFAVTRKATPELDRAYEKRRLVEQQCETMMSDAALGQDRRITRSVCDQMLQRAESEIQQARATGR